MMDRRFTFAFVATVGLALLPFPAEACMSKSVKMRDNGTAQRYMEVRSGRSCSIGFTSMGPMSSVKIVRRPSHGKVESDHFMRVKYTANKGYTGPDSYAYARVGQDSKANSTVRTIEVTVKVIP